MKVPPPPAGFQFHLDLHTGVPIYRQILDQVLLAIAAGTLRAGDQLPTVRQVAVDLRINPNTVLRAYRELEIRGTLTTQQGTGTFISAQGVVPDEAQRRARLAQVVGELVARASQEGYSVRELRDTLDELFSPAEKKGD